MPGDMEREIRDLLTRLLAQRDETDRELRGEVTKIKEDVATMKEGLTKLTAREEVAGDARTSLMHLRDDVIKLKTQMAIVGVVAGALLVAVVALVFRVFAGAP